MIDRSMIEAIARAEGTSLEEATFDGRKLKWTAEARRLLREVPDAYLRRRAKARIEKMVRMQKLSVVTRELAVPLVEETVGSDRLDASRGSQEADGEVFESVAAASPNTVSEHSTKLDELKRTTKMAPSQSHLNWVDAETGGLNEVAAGRVAVIQPLVHGVQD